MKIQNTWESYFEAWLDVTEFTLIKHKDGWGLYDRQGGNLGDIEGDRFESAEDILDRMEAYINDYIFDDLENELDVYDVDMGDREVPWSAEEWLSLRHEIYNKSNNKKYFDNHRWEFVILDMIANHAKEIDLEKIYYEERA